MNGEWRMANGESGAGHDSLGFTLLVAVSDAADGGGALREILLAPDGKVQSVNGDFVVDEESGRLVVEAFEAQGNDLPIDYEHHTLGGEFASPDGLALAAGWIKSIRYEPGRGLIATVEWTPRGREAIRAKEYRYLSPVVIVRKKDRKLVGIHSAALTNKPAIPRMETLAAKVTTPTSERDGMKEKLERQVNQEETEAGEVTPDQKIGQITELLKGKGVEVSEGASRDAVLDAVIAFLRGDSASGDEEGGASEEVAASVRKMLALAADAPKEQVMLALSRMTERAGSAGEMAALRKELDEVKACEAKRKADELVANAIKENKLNPENKDQIAWAHKCALNDHAQFVEYLNCTTPYVQPGRTQAPAQPPAESDAEEELIANAVKEADGNFAAGLVALQTKLLQPYKERGLTNKAAGEACRETYPKIFGAAA